jgi:ATP/maltotriose-dependent transcriptional regulator MalT
VAQKDASGVALLRARGLDRGVARSEADLLRLLANPTNRSILGFLALEPQYPRRLAELVGLTEDEASKRLRLFERVGLAAAEWANLGKTVRLYRLVSTRFTFEVGASGLIVTGLHGGAPIEVSTLLEAAPKLHRFVGRADELAHLHALVASRPGACIHGIGGSGKTTLAARFAETWSGPVVWHTVATSETPAVLLGRLAAQLRAFTHGETAQRLLALQTPDDASLLAGAVRVAADESGALVVLDRLEAASDDATATLAAVAAGLQRARVLAVGRVFHKALPRDLFAPLLLEGLDAPAAEALIESLGVRLGTDALERLQSKTRGHPLTLVLFALAAAGQAGTALGDGLEERLLGSGIREFLLTDVLPQLPPTERDFLLAIAVLDLPFLPDEAAAVAGTQHALNLLLRLEARGLVARSGDAFLLHDLVREFAVDGAPDRVKRHVAAARVLAASGEPAKVLEAVHHLTAAGRHADAARLVRAEAVERTYRFFDAGLGPRYRTLLSVLSGVDLQPPDRAAVMLELALAEAQRGDVGAAERHLDATARIIGDAKDPLSTRLALARGALQRRLGNLAATNRRYGEAVVAAEASGSPGLLLEAIVEHALCAEEMDDALASRLIDRALELSKDATDVRLLSSIYASAGRIGTRLGDASRLPLAEEGIRLARLAGYLRGEALGLMTVAVYDAIVGNVERGLEHAMAYKALAERLGDPWIQACSLIDVAFLEAARGDYAAALEHARACYDLAAELNSPMYVLGSGVALAVAWNGLGRHEEVLQTLPPLLQRETAAWPVCLVWGWRAIAVAAEQTGDATRADEARRTAEHLGKRVLAEARKQGIDAMLWAPTPGRAPKEAELNAGRWPAVPAQALAPATPR